MNNSKIQDFTLYIFFFFVNFKKLKIFNLESFSIPKLSALIYLITILPQFKNFLLVREIKPFLIPLWLFFGLLTIVSYFNISSMNNAYVDVHLLQFILLFWVIINHGLKRPMVLERAMLSLAFGSIILAVFYSLGIGTEFVAGRALIFGDNPNIIGLRMCISILILSIAVFQNKLELGKVRFLILTAIPIMLQLMAETASRVAFISFIISVGVGIIIIFRSKRIWFKFIVYIIGAITFMIIFQYLMEYDILRYRLIDSYLYGDLSGRVHIYYQTIPFIQRSPFFGIGKTGYFVLFGEASPNNKFLEIMIYAGSIGLLLYLIFLFNIIKKAYMYMRETSYILPLILLIPILGMMVSGQILGQKLGWIIFAYIISCSLGKKGQQHYTFI